MGVWIETLFICTSRPRAGSHPTWVCGLKLKNVEYGKEKAMSHPTWVCGLKQWWGEHVYRQPVTPYVGVWIETSIIIFFKVRKSHTLRGCVDWNNVIGKKRCGVWSHPTWVCGLKLSNLPLMRMASKVTPYVGVWIETPWYLLYLFLPGSHTLRGCVDWNTHMWLFSKP